MKRLWILLGLLLLTMISGCGTGNSPTPSTSAANTSASSGNNAGNSSSNTFSNSSGNSTNNNSSNSSGSSSISQPSKEVQVKIHLIKMGDNGKSGEKIATGDSLVAVQRTITTPETPLKAAFDALLAEPENGSTGLYNPLAMSKVQFEKATITNGKAEVYLSGKVATGGEMDIPRVESQLKATALQFPTVKTVQIYLNGKTIEDALSLKG